MNVLILGSGGREHAMAWKIAQSPLLSKLYIAPGNAGTNALGTNLNLGVSDFQAIEKVIHDKNISVLIVGPEVPLVNGLHDFLKENGKNKNLKIIGPKKNGAQLEGSKDFAKKFMLRHNIPTAAYQTFTIDTITDAKEFLKQMKAPYVIKADGLAAGKGVIICNELCEAEATIDLILDDNKFGEAGAKVVIEEFLEGIELSVFVLTNGTEWIVLPEAKDYKRIGEGDTGPNTGGMGSISPVPFANEKLLGAIRDRIITPTINGLQQDNIPYMGFIFIGLMNCNGNPYVIEYNVRMGDPETESVIPRIKSDFLEACIACADNTLNDYNLETDDRYAASLMLVSEGYPNKYEKGKEIFGLDNELNGIAFHAGTANKEDKIITNGGRVIALTAYGDTLKEALDKAYQCGENISFDGKTFRNDIGADLLKYL